MQGLEPIDLLVLDDDPLALETFSFVLGERYDLRMYQTSAEAEAALEKGLPRAAVLDLNLGSESGLEVLRRWKQRFPDLDILFCSGELHADRAMECLRHGASEYVTKPFDPDLLRCVLERLLEKQELRRGIERLRPLVRPLPAHFIGSSEEAERLRRDVEQLRGQTSLNVLLLGESGTGKEVVARLLHQQEVGLDRPFVVANMPAIPSSLVEAELFGVERGAYTDAKVARAGRFEMADGGDIFLDEIAEIPTETQAKLLRALQERVVERVGGTKPKRVRFRAIAATNQPIDEMVAARRFREDLLFRLGDVILRLPPLRDRLEDIPELVEHFAKKHSGLRNDGLRPQFSANALAQMAQHRWPGNVRELESTVKRAIAFATQATIEALPPMGAPFARSNPKPTVPASDEITATLARFAGDRILAQRALGLSRATFYRRLKEQGLTKTRQTRES